MTKKVILIIMFSAYSLYAQSGDGSKSLSKMINQMSVSVGMNQSFYDKDWNDIFDDIEDFMKNEYDGKSSLNKVRFPNFTLMGEFEGDVLGGVKYLKYGYNFETSYPSTEDNNYTSQDNDFEFETTFLKLFLTYPLGNGVYLGVEGGYFLEGYRKWKNTMIEEDGLVDNYESDYEITLEDWTEILGYSEYDYGILLQYFHGLSNKVLINLEGYYGLSKFDEDMDYDESSFFIPNTFHYLNLGVTYKLGNK